MSEKFAEIDTNRKIKDYWKQAIISGGLTVAFEVVYQLSNIVAILGKNEIATINSAVAGAGAVTFGLLTIDNIIKREALKRDMRK